MRGTYPHTRIWRLHTPHPSELLSTSGAALSHKGRGHNNAQRLSLSSPRRHQDQRSSSAS
ncbi:hypothetical protein CV770_05660 [Bradyrhizobium sp. AC87j1]|nr:hypothetical protein CV770_05660 [Bradyrhizobium sp. AC87j1]